MPQLLVGRAPMNRGTRNLVLRFLSRAAEEAGAAPGGLGGAGVGNGIGTPGVVGGDGPSVGPGGSQQNVPPFSSADCANAFNESGQIDVVGITGTATLAVGWTATRGTWVNRRTGTRGKFTTVGFTAGVGAGLNIGEMEYSSLGAFAGPSDGFSIGAGIGIDWLSVGLSYTHAYNSSGSGSGGGLDLGASAFPLLNLTGS